MSNPIRSCLTYLQNHSIEQADEKHLLPPGNNLDDRVGSLVTSMLGRDAPPLTDEDFSAIRKVYDNPSLSPDQKNRLFQVCVQTGLVSSWFKKIKASRIASHRSLTAQPYVLKATLALPSNDHTEKNFLDLFALFEGVDDPKSLLQVIQKLPTEALTEKNRPIIVSFAQVFDDWALSLMDLLDPSKRISVMGLLLDTWKSFTEAPSFFQPDPSFVLPMLFHDPSLRESSYAYLQKVLSINTDAAFCYALSQNVIVYQKELLLTEEHPLLRLAILTYFGGGPEAEQEPIVSFVLDILRGITNENNHRNELLRLMRTLSSRVVLIPANFATIRSFVQEIPYHLLNSIIFQLPLLAPSTWITALNILLEAQRAGVLENSITIGYRGTNIIRPVLSLLFYNDPSLRDTSFNYLQRELTTNTHPDILYFLAQKVIDFQEDLGLHHGHALFLEAIRALILSDPDASANPKNPYVVFTKLTKLHAESIALHPPILPVDGQKFSVSMQPLLEQAQQIKNSITFDHLPPEVNADILRILFQNLDARLSRLSDGAQRTALEQIESQCGSSYESLKTEMLGDPYLYRLLHTTGPTNERVPLDVMQLFVILDFVLTQPETMDRGEALTKREEILLKMASSIRYCSGGKKEGIFLAYSWIQGSSSSASSSREETKAYLYSLIYQALTAFLSEDSPLMRALTGTDEIEQLAHQAIYVKNLIGIRVGLVWELTFDQSTNLLYDALMAKTLEEVLQIFFQYFSPEALIKVVQAQINRDLAATSPSDPIMKEKANTFYALLFEQLGENSDYFEFDFDEDGLPKMEDSEPPKLTAEGSAKLLTKFGYLQEVI